MRGPVAGSRNKPIATTGNLGYHQREMNVAIADAKNQLSELIQAVERGQEVVITRDGTPVAQLTLAPVPPERGRVRLGTMRDRIKLNPGWDRPISLEEFIAGEF